MKALAHRFVEFVPDEIEDGIIYVEDAEVSKKIVHF